MDKSIIEQGSISARILKAMSVFSGVQALGILCSIVRTKLISLWIGTVGIGLSAVFYTVLDMISTTTQLNVRQTAVRDISNAEPQRVERVAGVVRWWTLRLGLLGMLLMVALSPLLSYFSFDTTAMWWGFAILSVAVPALAVTNGEQALMQGRGRLALLAKCTAMGTVWGTLLSLPIYYFFGEASIVPALILMAVVGAVFALAYRQQRSTPGSRRENFKAGLPFLRLGAYLTVSSLAVSASQYALISYIGHVSQGLNDVGIFQAGYTLVAKYTMIIFSAMALEYFPRLVNVAERKQMASAVVSHELSVILAVICPVIVIFVTASELAIYVLYTSEFMSALPMVTVGICGSLPRAVSYVMAYVIIARGDGRIYVVTDLLSSVIGLALNIVMYRLWGFLGLGIAYVVWYVLYTVIVGIVYYRRYGMHIKAATLRLLALTTLIVCAALMLKPVGWWAASIMLLPAGMLTYRALKSLMK